MRKYEIMFIVRTDIDENTQKDVVSSLEKIFADFKANVTLSKELGQKGGYTRILKVGIRKGDNAEMAIIELI